jgi:prepilin-type N-terminal cleavage/methylation domain-containing protein/prepilin-type processing-associated H-X9-DG protein
MSTRQKKGFTLIELLVVIAIIALLLSILMPSLQKVKAVAQSVVCRSNLRQMTMGLKLYAQDNDDKTMLFNEQVTGKYWFHEIAPYLGDQNYQDTGGKQVSKAMETSYCPSTKKPVPRTTWEMGATTKPWTFIWSGNDNEATGSYGMNLWLMPDGPSVPGVFIAERHLFYQKLTDARANTPAFADCAWVGQWPRGVAGPINFDIDAIGGINIGGLKAFVMNRHNKAINMGFADGHVENVKLEALWTLSWNRDFIRNSDVTINY